MQRREDPRIIEVKREVLDLRKQFPLLVFIGSLFTVGVSAGVGFEVWRANLATRAQLETEQAERRAAEAETARTLSKLEGKLDVLIMQLGKGKR